ncbi:unnamed protein product [Ectocarpus fasciculatus]
MPTSGRAGSSKLVPRQQGVPSSEEGASDQAMRLLKRMRPDELRELSKAATALEKTKLENSKKVAAFVAKNDNFVNLVGDCYFCLEPLLSNIGTTRFGVLSWRCRCTVPPKAHSGCVFSKICHAGDRQGVCDMCGSPMVFEKTRRKGTQATIRFHRDEKRSPRQRLRRRRQLAGRLRGKTLLERSWLGAIPLEVLVSSTAHATVA